LASWREKLLPSKRHIVITSKIDCHVADASRNDKEGVKIQDCHAPDGARKDDIGRLIRWVLGAGYWVLGKKFVIANVVKQSHSFQNKPSYRSFHSGLNFSMSSIFFFLLPALICFSLFIASSIFSKAS